MKDIRRVPLLAFVLLIAACASAPTGEDTQVRRSPVVITAEEIQASAATTVYELINALRPNWLRGRGGSVAGGEDGGGAIVYLNQSRIGGVGELQQMAVGGVTRIDFVDARAATQRWGTGHTRGAIVVSTSAARP
jgi:hypothetical protein